MDEQTRKRLEYEEQIFDYPSDFFLECFKNLVKDELESAVNKAVKLIQQKLIKEAKNPELFNQMMRGMRKELHTEYNRALDDEVLHINQHISNLMNIPDHVLLPEDFPVRTGLATDISEVDAEINTLRGKFKAMNYMKHKILEEMEVADTVIFILDNINDKKQPDFSILNTENLAFLAKTNLSLVK